MMLLANPAVADWSDQAAAGTIEPTLHTINICSPYDREARFSQKRSTAWVGYKVPLTETCDSEGPLLITHVETTAATLQDSSVVDKLHGDLAALEVLPREHLIDTAAVSSDVLVTSKQAGVELVGPVRTDNSWQARDDQALDSAQFQIDGAAQVAICPQGKRSRSWGEYRDGRDKPAVRAVFGRAACQPCPLRERCTKGAYRTLTVQQQAEYAALQAARQRQQTAEYREQYKGRSGIEGALSQAVYACQMRRTRYWGLRKTQLQHVAACPVAVQQRRRRPVQDGYLRQRMETPVLAG
jgi:transposase